MNDYYNTISFDNLYESCLKCSHNVKWKRSTAHFLLNQLEETHKLYSQLKNGSYKECKHKIFKVYEPKEREVLSIAFKDRVYQRTLNDLVIYPIMTKSFIYDNCACQKGKGTDFARKRLKKHLRSYYCRNGNKGYLIHIDIKKYYPNMSHKVAVNLFKEKLPSEIFVKVLDMLKNYKGEKGYYAGSQLIQILGISILDKLDHYIKEQLKVKHYVRYMDDLIVIVKDKPMFYLEKIKKQLSNIEFEINYEKTKVVRLYKGDTFLGFKFSLSNSGKVYQCLATKNIKRAKRKINTRNQASFETWWSYATKSTSRKRIMEVKKLYEKRNKIKTITIRSNNT